MGLPGGFHLFAESMRSRPTSCPLEEMVVSMEERQHHFWRVQFNRPSGLPS